MTQLENLNTQRFKKQPSEKVKNLFYFLNGKRYYESPDDIYRFETPNNILKNVGTLIGLDQRLFKHYPYNNDSKDVDKYVGNLIIEASSQPSALVLLTNVLTNKKLFDDTVANPSFEPRQPQPELIKQLVNKSFEEQVEITAYFLLNSLSDEILRIYGKSKGEQLLPEYLRRFSRILFFTIPENLSLNNLRDTENGFNYTFLFKELSNIPLKDIVDQEVNKTEEEQQKRKKYKNLRTKYNFKIKQVDLNIDIGDFLVEATFSKKKAFWTTTPKKVSTDSIRMTHDQDREHSNQLLDLLFSLTPEGKILPQIETNLRLLSQIQCIFPENPIELVKKLHTGSIKERKELIKNLANGWSKNIDGNKITFPGINNKRLELQLKWILTQKDKQFLVFPFAKVNENPISWRDFMRKDNPYPSTTVKTLNHNSAFSLPPINYDTAWDKNRQHGDIGEQTPTDGWAMIIIQDNNENVGFTDYYNDLMLPEYGLAAFSLASMIKPHNISALGNFLQEDYGTIFFPSTEDNDFNDIRLNQRIDNRIPPELWVQLYTKDYYEGMKNVRSYPEDRIKGFLSGQNAKKIGFVLKIS